MWELVTIMPDTIGAFVETAPRSGNDNLSLDCYIFAIDAIAHYSPEIEPEITAPHRKYLRELAERVALGGPDALEESRATLRGLLRDYRDKMSRYLNVLREDVSSAAVALAEILEGLSESDGDQADRLRETLRILHNAPGDDCDSIRQSVANAANTIENCVSSVRKQHQLSISQFLMEIRMLHRRIDALESAAS